MDLSKFSDADLDALEAGDMTRLSDAALNGLSAAPPSFGERFATGMADPLHGGAQFLMHAVGDTASKTLNKVTQTLNEAVPITEALGMTPKAPEDFDAQLRQREADYQSRREPGFDGARMAGGFAATLPIVAAGIPATTGARVLAGAGMGGGMGLLNPALSEDYGKEKSRQFLLGAATGGIVPGVARAITPADSAAVRTLTDAGVRPTIGQMLGGRAAVNEEKLTSIPVLGDLIANARRRAADDLNRAAHNRALGPIGERLEGNIGRDGLNEVEDKIGSAYNQLLPQVTFQADPQFAQALQQVQQMASTLPATQARQFEQIFREKVIGKMTPQGNMSGVQLKEVESDLGRLSRDYRSSPDPDQRHLGEAFQEVQAQLRQGLERSNPQHAEQLRSINEAYANLVRLRTATAATGAENGVFSPAQLQAAVRASDKSGGKRQFARGDALMQDLSDAGKSVLGSKYPDSGTMGRGLLAGSLLGGAGGAAMVSPYAAMGIGAAALPYLSGSQAALAHILARSAPAGQGLAHLGPSLGAIAAQLSGSN